MNVHRNQDVIQVELSTTESLLLMKVLKTLDTLYATPPDELDDRARQTWYSTRGCESSGMSESQARDWTSQLHQLRSGRLGLLRRCRQSLEAQKSDPSSMAVLELKVDEAVDLITLINDHRLLLAARHDLGQEDLNRSLLESLDQMNAVQVTALCEIELLAYLMESILQVLPGGED